MGMDGVILLGFLLGFPANEIVLPVLLMAYTCLLYTSMRFQKRDNVGWDAGASLSRIAVITGSFVSSSAQLSSK